MSNTLLFAAAGTVGFIAARNKTCSAIVDRSASVLSAMGTAASSASGLSFQPPEQVTKLPKKQA